MEEVLFLLWGRADPNLQAVARLVYKTMREALHLGWGLAADRNLPVLTSLIMKEVLPLVVVRAGRNLPVIASLVSKIMKEALPRGQGRVAGRRNLPVLASQIMKEVRPLFWARAGRNLLVTVL